MNVLFRTKFVAAFAALAMVAIGCAALLILSSHRSALNQVRTTLAYDSLSGYFQLSGAVFRTFKQARRDLVSGTGEFAFNLTEAELSIARTLSEIEAASLSEAGFATTPLAFDGVRHIERLRAEIEEAFDAIQQASGQILSGDVEAGRRNAIGVLERTVDARIAVLIEEAIAAERSQLETAQDEIRFINNLAQVLAWFAVATSLLLSGVVLVTLVRRLSTSLKALDTGAKAYAVDQLDHVIALPGADELSAVAERFNEMAQQILSKRQALENAQQELEQRVAERTAELSDANNELIERDRLRRQFFADIGHELRTPVTAIRGVAEVALRVDDTAPSQLNDALTTIVSLSEQLTASVNDLFLIAREQAGVLDFRTQVMDLNSAVDRGVEQISTLTTESGAMIIGMISPDEIEIEGDPGRISQLVRILVANALTHTQNGVTIEISTCHDGPNAVLTVADNGPGIPQKDWPVIFDRYVTGTGDRRRPASGTGLGLAIAKSITKAHGGAIAVGQSDAGGAKITATFPTLPVESAHEVTSD